MGTSVITPVPGSRQGLSASEAAHRLQRDGPNTLGPQQKRSFWHLMGELIRDPMLQLLIGAGVVYLFLGSTGEALMLLGFVVVSIAISVSQAQRTKRVPETRRGLTSGWKPHQFVEGALKTRFVPDQRQIKARKGGI
ncbi:cation-transporting P-type ATPase [Rhodoferax sp.]|jgi:Ca2+-transporting ATPase|uniref:cation-transporting P-type ATPase n=1 Tax=Rhodoferax sp. TaxID=50421 RepID=UPI0037837B95